MEKNRGLCEGTSSHHTPPSRLWSDLPALSYVYGQLSLTISSWASHPLPPISPSPQLLPLHPKNSQLLPFHSPCLPQTPLLSFLGKFSIPAPYPHLLPPQVVFQTDSQELSCSFTRLGAFDMGHGLVAQQLRTPGRMCPPFPGPFGSPQGSFRTRG